MKNKTLVTLLAVVMLFAVVSTVYATAPVVNILSPTGTLTFSSFPQTVPVRFSLTHDANIQSINDATLYVNNVAVGSINPSGAQVTYAEFEIPWNILGVGTYQLKVTATHGNDTGQDVETVIVAMGVVTVDYPAAPAIAARLLRENGVAGRNRGYYVSMVALYMGPQTDFAGVAKSNVAAYEAAVNAFLMANGAY